MRFERNYLLTITVAGETIELRPPMQLKFSATKSIYGGLNKANVQISNLKESTRLKLVKDKEDAIRIPLALYIGYQNTLDLIFKGTVFRGTNSRQGVDFVTSLETLDGGFDFLNSFTSATVVTKSAAISKLVSDMPNTNKGFITNQANAIRPIVLVGNSARLIQQQLNAEETYYIEDETLHILKPEDVTDALIPVASADTGLMNTPERQNKRVTFSTILNPSIKIGRRCKLISLTAPHLNGIYRVEDISFSGDYYGQDWTQTITGSLR